MAFKRHKKAGLTLLELLVASSMAVFIGLGIYRTFCSGISAYNWLCTNKPQNDAVIFFEKIAYDLRNYCRIPGMEFSGSVNRMSFYVHDTDYLLFSPDDIRSSEEETGMSLFRVEYVFLPGKGQVRRRIYGFSSDTPRVDTEALGGVENLAFKFCLSDGSGNLLEFCPAAGKTPVAVEIKVDKFRRIIKIPVNAV